MTHWGPFARHYVQDMVYAANDGIVTTFAVVAGVRGAGLDATAVLALGLANLVADGLSMGVGDYLGIKSKRATELRTNFHEWRETVHAAKHGGVTWMCFVVAGTVPLLPFLFSASVLKGFHVSSMISAVALYGIGALRTLVTTRSPWRSGLEMLAVGALAGAAAFLTGWTVERTFSGK